MFKNNFLRHRQPIITVPEFGVDKDSPGQLRFKQLKLQKVIQIKIQPTSKQKHPNSKLNPTFGHPQPASFQQHKLSGPININIPRESQNPVDSIKLPDRKLCALISGFDGHCINDSQSEGYKGVLLCVNSLELDFGPVC